MLISSDNIPRKEHVIEGVFLSHMPVSHTKAYLHFNSELFFLRNGTREGDDVSSSPSRNKSGACGGLQFLLFCLILRPTCDPPAPRRLFHFDVSAPAAGSVFFFILFKITLPVDPT